MAGSRTRTERRWGVAAAWLAAGATAVSPGAYGGGPKAAKPGKVPVPSAHVTLASLGAPGVSQAFLSAGMSMLTVHTLDARHLLVTFATRDLIPRIKGDPDTHDDRIVAGEVVELPSGKVLAKTSWHLHDHGRYMWSVGHGALVVRIGDNLSLMTPLANLGTADPFLRTALPHHAGRPAAVQGSADGDLLTVVTEVPAVKKEKPTVILVGDPRDEEKPTYAVEFFRLNGTGTRESPLQVSAAGMVKSGEAVLLPVDADGYLWATDDQRKRWTVTFNGFEGKVIPAGVIDSSCAPRLRMLSHSQYAAITCRGMDQSPKLQVMGLDGHETWEEPFGEFLEVPEFQFAPAAGRFAMLKTQPGTPQESLPGSAGGTSAAAPAGVSNQELRVYQTESGDLLLRVPAVPAFRVPENFALSEDGRTVAIIHADAIDVYDLPAPSKKDMDELAEVEQFRPPASTGPVKLSALVQAAAREPEGAASDNTEALAAPVSTTTEAELPVAAPANEASAGDVPPTGSRKRPTLLNPGETAEFKDKKAPVQ